MSKSRLLTTEQPIVINRELAKLIGLNEAIVLQQIQYWININEKAHKTDNFKEGYYWTYNTVDQWNEEFPFWSYDTVKRTLKKLRDNNILITGTYNKLGADRTIWYRINHDALIELENKKPISAKCTNEENSHSQDVKTLEPLETLISAKCPNAIGQNAPSNTRDYYKDITSSSSNDDLVKLFNENICELKKTTEVKFLECCCNLDIDFIKAVIKYGAETNAKSYNWFSNVIKKNIEKGINTKENFELSIEEFRAKKENKKRPIKNKSNKSKDNFTNYKGQREYDFNELERKLLGWD